MSDTIDRLIDLERKVSDLEIDGRANTADSAPRRAFANLPTAVGSGRWFWVTDGRQTGETAGNGTGILAVDVIYSGTSLPDWVRVDDNDVLVTI